MTADASPTLPRYWQPVEAATAPAPSGIAPPVKSVQCGLCFRACTLDPGQRGFCGARLNNGTGQLQSPYLGRFVSCAIDPIEKKPLYHWRPGSSIFSLGSVGCTMHCPFCQNASIAHPTRWPEPAFLSISDLVATVQKHRLDSVAYTYNEPSLQAEYIIAASPVLKEAGIATVLVTNGMFSPSLLHDLSICVAAVNIDCKTFSHKNYAKLGGCLDTMKRSAVFMKEAGIHVELTCLVVPGISDNPDEFANMVDWIASLGPDTPLHISRYFPRYKYTEPQTSIETLEHFEKIARSRLAHVHLGNVRF